MTGDEFETPDDPASRSLYRFKLASKGLDRIARLFRLRLYFLTLTLREENAEKVNRDLNKFLNFLRARFRRADHRWFYLWVVELQKKRYYKSGVKALHWHFAIISQDGALPDVEFRKHKRPHYLVKEEGGLVKTWELYKRWGYGQVFCRSAWSNGVYDYLAKYFTKDYGALPGFNADWSTLRRFNSSRLGCFCFPAWAWEQVKLFAGNPNWRFVRKGGIVIIKRRDEKGFYECGRIYSPYRLTDPGLRQRW